MKMSIYACLAADNGPNFHNNPTRTASAFLPNEPNFPGHHAFLPNEPNSFGQDAFLRNELSWRRVAPNPMKMESACFILDGVRPWV